jgi:predicted GIY-YIG superfamily endonuclease
MAKPSQLVCQHLENVSRDALKKHQDIVRRYVRGRQGIYALYRRNKLYYVGLAGNLPARLTTHLRDKHQKSWDRFSVYLTIGDKHMREIESLLLRIAKPPGNKVGGRFVKSENLRGKFMSAVRQKQRKELDDLVGRTAPAQTSTERKRQRRAYGARQVALAGYVRDRMKLKARYKGKTYSATARKDGRIYFNGKLYNSPSAAGEAVIKRACNGWKFWQYERAPGDWVPLRELRK